VFSYWQDPCFFPPPPPLRPTLNFVPPSNPRGSLLTFPGLTNVVITFWTRPLYARTPFSFFFLGIFWGLLLPPPALPFSPPRFVPQESLTLSSSRRSLPTSSPPFYYLFPAYSHLLFSFLRLPTRPLCPPPLLAQLPQTLCHRPFPPFSFYLTPFTTSLVSGVLVPFHPP